MLCGWEGNRRPGGV